MKSIRSLKRKGVNLITFKDESQEESRRKVEKKNLFIGLCGIFVVGFMMAMFIWMVNLLRRFFLFLIGAFPFLFFCLHFNAVADNEKNSRTKAPLRSLSLGVTYFPFGVVIYNAEMFSDTRFIRL